MQLLGVYGMKPIFKVHAPQCECCLTDVKSSQQGSRNSL